MTQTTELSYQECHDLLTGGVVGRVAMSTPAGPHIVPVNYAVIDDSIVFRTAPYSVVGTYAWNNLLAFEVDQIDYEHQHGWSVVASGRGRLVESAEELTAITTTWDPRPWADGSRPMYVRLEWDALTGRRLGGGWSAVQSMPVRRVV
ncbi:pyridoxamine 5'-phosphate oxidase family protein [Nocardioides pacificus]